jgi:hypothetical protein
MGANYVKAHEGKMFVLTEAGFEVPRIRVKFESGTTSKLQNEKAVPKSWIENGWVKEVDRCM